MEPGGMVAFEFRFDANDPTFAGHFPGRPILPGVFQIEMARAAAEWTLECALEVREVSKAKFLRPISPGEQVRLELSWTETNSIIQARARLSAGGQSAAERHCDCGEAHPNKKMASPDLVDHDGDGVGGWLLGAWLLDRWTAKPPPLPRDTTIRTLSPRRAMAASGWATHGPAVVTA